jgi:hypothetical protein
MAAHAKTDRDHGPSANNPMLQLFATNEGFLWPYRSFAKTLMQTQMGAWAYLEANRKLTNQVLDLVRKEQDLSLEMSSKVLKKVAGSDGPSVRDLSDVNAMFQHAFEGMRELSEAWMTAQMHSLDVVREQTSASARRKSHPARRSAAHQPGAR